MTPIGRCTARLQIRESTFIASFIVLRECSRKVILGMDFLREHGAVIDLRDLLITFADGHAPKPSDTNVQRTALRIVDDAVTLPPRTSMFVTVQSDIDHGSSGIAEANLSVLLARQICVARGIIQIQRGMTELLLTNFSGEYQHLAKRTVVAHFEAIDDEACSTIAPISAAINGDTTVANTVDVNPKLSCSQKEQIRCMLHMFSDCFASTSKIKQTPTVKHRIITNPAERPVRQRVYRVSQREQEVIRSQVK